MKYLRGELDENQYKITKELGSGSFGIVYKAEDLIDKRDVAIKVFHNQNGVNRDDWLREVEQATGVEDKNVIKIYDFIEAEDEPYIVMEYASNGSIRDFIESYSQNDKFIPLNRIVDIMKQSLKGLDVVHKRSLHRDIKPENLLLLGSLVKISDFGLAKYVDEATRSKTYKGWGTWFYMAPESWSLGSMTAASDLYSLGILFYELSTLELPYQSSDPKELEEMHRYSQIPNARDINAELPVGLVGIIGKSMQKQVSDRYQSAIEMLDDVNKIRLDVGSQSKVSDAVKIALKINDKEQQIKSEEAKEREQERHSLKRNQYKIDEFIDLIKKVVDDFNQSMPQNKLILSKGTSVDYNLIWKDRDLLRFKFDPNISGMNLNIKGNNILAYGYAEFASIGRKQNEGLNFILTGEIGEYGQWKTLEVRGNPAVRGPNYSVSIELELLERFSKLGNTMDAWTWQVRDCDIQEEIFNLITRAFKYLESFPTKE